jgi:hypothetical protein
LVETVQSAGYCILIPCVGLSYVKKLGAGWAKASCCIIVCCDGLYSKVIALKVRTTNKNTVVITNLGDGSLSFTAQ